jgi:hypothetical protein
MRLRLALHAVAAVFTAAAACAQLPVFDVDDFVAPDGGKAMFISRLVTGGVANLTDTYRPVEQDAWFVHVANDFYWSNYQLDYKHMEVRGSDESGPVEVQSCHCAPPIYFPTPAPHDATPAAPLPGSRDALQFSWYHRQTSGATQPPIVLRSRVTYIRQTIHTIVSSLLTGAETGRLSGSEQSFGVDTDVAFTFRRHRVFGSLLLERTLRSNTADDRAQTTVAYIARFPVLPLRNVLLRATVTLAGVSGRGSNGLNVVNPAFEAFWHDGRSDGNVHLIWSPQTSRDGLRGWHTNHEIALVFDRAIFVHVFGS